MTAEVPTFDTSGPWASIHLDAERCTGRLQTVPRETPEELAALIVAAVRDLRAMGHASTGVWPRSVCVVMPGVPGAMAAAAREGIVGCMDLCKAAYGGDTWTAWCVPEGPEHVLVGGRSVPVPPWYDVGVRLQSFA